MGSLLLTLLQLTTDTIDTFILIGGAAATGIVIWVLGNRLKTRVQTANAEVIRSALILLLTAVVAGVLLTQWGATETALSIVGVFEFGIGVGIRILLTIIMAVAAYTLTRILKRLLLGANSSTNRITSEHQRRVSFYISQVAIYIVAVFALLSLWGVQLGDLLLGAGVLGIVLGFAAQETLGSILAGFILMLSRPFAIGDWVRIGDHEGFITEITINNVRLRNLDGEHVVLPNEAVNNRTIINRSIEGKLRLRVEVGIDYDVDPDHAEAVALEALTELEEIMSQPAPQVLPVRFDDSAVILELRFWIDKPTPQRKWRATQVVIHNVKAAFRREGIKIPFPQRELMGRKETGGFRVVDDELSGQPEPDSHPPTSSTDRSE
ncbi:mechanosensitive ion channel family protein [Halonotius aquaticus]|uniref:Mechanosensitive ion channel family protein n=1 Tax=Halonotius aquaticus TaxID=2216978 RepID=A0A3A6PR61_9EURY|nr:mechanosensitive ion channel family protein [Halonotius aquaticus]RJX43018.1 mechanosensitive ion channel family protein [Halonotius aquaticus]